VWAVLLGGLLTVAGGAISVRWIAPWAATYQRAQQRWEDDLVALDDLLAWELPEAVNDLTNAWEEIRWELEALESLRSQQHVQAAARGPEIARKQTALEEAMVAWKRLAGSRLELLARHVEHRHTSWGERSVLVAGARTYRLVFRPLPVSWDRENIARLNTEFNDERDIRGRLLASVRKQGAHLWPSREPLIKRFRSKFGKGKSRSQIGTWSAGP
jgi:hypothetical protein